MGMVKLLIIAAIIVLLVPEPSGVVALLAWWVARILAIWLLSGLVALFLTRSC